MKKILLLATTLTLLSIEPVQSQAKSTDGGQPGYKTALGLRFGFEGGVSLKHSIKERNALEGILSTNWGYGGFRFTGLYEVHKVFPGVEGLDWFFGGGAHIGFYGSRYYGHYGHVGGGYYDRNGRWHPNGYRSNYMTLGIDGIIGVEYQFEDLPLTASLDFKPYFDFLGWNNRFGDGALTVRYILK